jgi:2'-5' RNA ligase
LKFRQFLETQIVHDCSSAQIYLPDNLSNNIIKWGYKHIPNKDLCINNSDFSRENEIHVTLLYGIHSDSPKQVKDYIRSQKFFSCKLGKISLFKNPKFDVVKIDVISKELHQLNNLLNKNIEATNIYKKYEPHVTIAYILKNKGDHLIGNNTFQGEKFMVHDIIFSSRTGKKISLPLCGK